MVYFAEDILNKRIKIGFSKNIVQRISSIQQKNKKIELLWYVDGDKKTELQLHKLFYLYRIQGEWFKTSKAILSFISKLKRKTEIEAVDSEYVDEIIHNKARLKLCFIKEFNQRKRFNFSLKGRPLEGYIKNTI